MNGLNLKTPTNGLSFLTSPLTASLRAASTIMLQTWLRLSLLYVLPIYVCMFCSHLKSQGQIHKTNRHSAANSFGGSATSHGKYSARSWLGLNNSYSFNRHATHRYPSVVVVPVDLGLWSSYFGAGMYPPIYPPFYGPSFSHAPNDPGQGPWLPSPYASQLESGVDESDERFDAGYLGAGVLAEEPPQIMQAAVSSLHTTASAPAVRGGFPIIITKAIARIPQRRAEAAFRAGDYHLAASLARQVVTLESDNGLAYLFSAQACFAIGDYDSALSNLRAASKILPVEQWGYIAKNFRLFYGQNDYVRHMNRLEQFLNERPVYVPARIVRAHQWASLGYLDEAQIDLRVATAYRPKDEFANRLLESLEATGLGVSQSSQLNPPFPSSSNLPPQPKILSTPKKLQNPSSVIESEPLPSPEENDQLELLDEFQLPDRTADPPQNGK